MAKPLLRSEAETTPVPPGSGPKLVDDARLAALVEQYAHVESVDELPPELRDIPCIRVIIDVSPEQRSRQRAAAAAWMAADFGDDLERERQALEDGTHPAYLLDG